jgi:hypothetical protein
MGVALHNHGTKPPNESIVGDAISLRVFAMPPLMIATDSGWHLRGTASPKTAPKFGCQRADGKLQQRGGPMRGCFGPNI